MVNFPEHFERCSAATDRRASALAAIPSAVLAAGPSECICSDPGHHQATLPRACPTNGSDRGFARSILNRFNR